MLVSMAKICLVLKDSVIEPLLCELADRVGQLVPSNAPSIYINQQKLFVCWEEKLDGVKLALKAVKCAMPGEWWGEDIGNRKSLIWR